MGTPTLLSSLALCRRKYLYRHRALRHLRIEQFNRYCALMNDNGEDVTVVTAENTRGEDEEDARFIDKDHRQYDEFMEAEPVGKKYKARCAGVPGCRRRLHSRLAVSRTALLEPIGSTREPFYCQRLLLNLSWYTEDMPQAMTVNSKPVVEWKIKWFGDSEKST